MISNKCKYRKVNRSNNNINNSSKKISGLMYNNRISGLMCNNRISGLMNNNRKFNKRRKYKKN